MLLLLGGGVGIPNSGNCNRASHFKTMLPAVFFCMIIIIMIFRHFCSLFHYLSVLFQFQLNVLYVFFFSIFTALMTFVWFSCVGFLWAVLDILHGFKWDCVLFFAAIYTFVFFLPVIALMVLSTVLPSCSLMLFQRGNLSTTVNSIHIPLHPSCLLFLPVTLSYIGFRCQLYCKNLANCICES